MTSPITPARPQSSDNTANPGNHFRTPIPNITASPIFRLRLPIPVIAASPTVPSWQPPRRDNTASPAQTPYRRFTPPASPRDVIASPTIQPPMDVTASLANRVTLNATPSTVEVDQQVRFELRFQRPPPPVPNIQYGFNFADGSPIEWTAVPRTIHQYSSAGTYQPSVEIRVGARVLDLPKILGSTVQVVPPASPTPTSTATSTPITPSPTPTAPSSTSETPIATAVPTAIPSITPIPPPPPPLQSSKMLWLYIGVGLAVAALAYLLFQRSKLKIPMAARPTFHPHSDWDAPQTPPKNLAINYGLYFHPNVSAGQDRLETDEPGSILKKRNNEQSIS